MWSGEAGEKEKRTQNAVLMIGLLLSLKVINLEGGMTNPKNECLPPCRSRGAGIYCTVILFRILIDLNLEIYLSDWWCGQADSEQALPPQGTNIIS